VVPAPPALNSTSMVVAIRGYCRFPPTATVEARCRRPPGTADVTLWYYDVPRASCVPLEGRSYHCSRSRNRFSSRENCENACIVGAAAVEEPPSSPS